MNFSMHALIVLCTSYLCNLNFAPYTHNCQYVMLQVFRHSLVYNFVDLVHRLFFVKISLKR